MCKPALQETRIPVINSSSAQAHGCCGGLGQAQMPANYIRIQPITAAPGCMGSCSDAADTPGETGSTTVEEA